MAKPKKDKQVESEALYIPPLETEEITFHLIGKTPLIFNRQSEKAKQQLLFPSPKKNAAERAQTLKHNPLEEFQNSPYRIHRDGEPTLLHMPSGAFKKCIAQAAIDIPGDATRAKIGRLVSLSSVEIHVWGVPHLRVDMVRQAGPNRTPDVRFRACLPEWCCVVKYEYVRGSITDGSIGNLLNASGIIVGVGDYRVEKGAGDFGKFKIVPPNNEDFLRIQETGGRSVQKAAMDISPIYYDDEAKQLVEWFYEEVDRRRSRRKEDDAAKAAKAAEKEAKAAEKAAKALAKIEARMVNGGDGATEI